MSFDPISYIEALKSRRLSNLIIDTDKDWGGRLIKNLGEPVDPNDAARKIYVDVATTGLGINYYLLDEADSEVTAYKKLSITPPELSEAYVEVTQNSSGDYEIASWIADGITTLKLGVYTLHFQVEKISGNIDVRLFFRLYERDTGGNETLIAESYLSDLITERRNVVIGLILAHDYEMAEGSRLVLKVFARYLSSGSPTTVRIYYQGTVRSRLAVPIAKEILDTLYAARVHSHVWGDVSDRPSPYSHDIPSSSYTVGAGAETTLLSESGEGCVIVLYQGDGSADLRIRVYVDGSLDDEFPCNETRVGAYAFTSSIEIRLYNPGASDVTGNCPTANVRGWVR